MGVVQALQANRLKSALTAGDQITALSYYRKLSGYNIQPNLKYGPTNGDNSPLHYTAMHGMKELYIELLERGGKPDLANGDKRNCLHLICQVARRATDRLEMLIYTLDWEPLQILDTKHLLKQKDKVGTRGFLVVGTLLLAISISRRTATQFYTWQQCRVWRSASRFVILVR